MYRDMVLDFKALKSSGEDSKICKQLQHRVASALREPGSGGTGRGRQHLAQIWGVATSFERSHS